MLKNPNLGKNGQFFTVLLAFSKQKLDLRLVKSISIRNGLGEGKQKHLAFFSK